MVGLIDEISKTVLTSQIREMDKFAYYQLEFSCSATVPSSVLFKPAGLNKESNYTMAYFGTSQDPRNTSQTTGVQFLPFNTVETAMANIFGRWAIWGIVICGVLWMMAVVSGG